MHACPCCGHRTLAAPTPSWLTCPVCYWTDEEVVTPGEIDALFVAQRTYAESGAGSRDWLDKVRRPTADEARADDWTPFAGRSPRDGERAALIDAIARAFAGVSSTGRESLRATYRHDYYSEPDIDWEDDDRSWNEIPGWVLEFFGNGTTVFVFGNPVGFRYYMPAFMTHSLRTGVLEIAVEALDVKLRPGQRPADLDEVRILDDDQRIAVAEFLRHVIRYHLPAAWAERALERVWGPVTGAS